MLEIINEIAHLIFMIFMLLNIWLLRRRIAMLESEAILKGIQSFLEREKQRKEARNDQ